MNFDRGRVADPWGHYQQRDIRDRLELERAIDAPGKATSWSWRNGTAPRAAYLMACTLSSHARGSLLKVLDKPHVDLPPPIGRGFIAFLSALAEDKYLRMVKRANDGRRAEFMVRT